MERTRPPSAGAPHGESIALQQSQIQSPQPGQDWKEAARDRWTEILTDLGGVDPAALEGNHCPCPSCGGDDRFRFDDKDGSGSWYCNQCGGRDQAGGGGLGITLLMRVRGWSFKEAAGRVRDHLGAAPFAAQPTRQSRRLQSVPSRAPLPPEPPALAALAQPIGVSSPYRYSDTQRTVRVDTGGGQKRFDVRHLDPKLGAWTEGAGPGPWPVLNEAAVISAGGWPVEIEGEKCAGILTARSVSAYTHPGHAHKFDQIRERYARMKAAGIEGVIIVSDSGDADTTKAGKPKTPEGVRRARVSMEAAAAVGLPYLHLKAVEVWPEVEGLAGASIDDVADPAQAVEALRRAVAIEHRRRLDEPPALVELQAPANRPRPTPASEDSTFYTVLGWDVDRTSIWYQPRSTGQIAKITPIGKSSLLRLAPIMHWERWFPGDRSGASWDAALSHVITQADRAGVFQVEGIRGRGIWHDAGRTVWHLGDRLEVDGKSVELIDHQSAFRYARLPALPIDPAATPLTDQQGWEIIEAVESLGWGRPTDHLLTLGWAVCSIAGGALPKRPGIQASSQSGSGKTTIVRLIWEPLFAGAALLRSGSSEAGIRQKAGPDALPVVVDETEAEENGNNREKLLRLMRHSYDGTPLDKGTTHGNAISYPVRFGMAILAVNGAIARATDANRIAQVSRQPLPLAAWHPLEARLERIITAQSGEALHRRVVDHLPALLANVRTFRSAVEALAPAGIEGRTADTYGPLLAGAHLLVSTATLTDQQAAAWLQTVGWSAAAMGDSDTNTGPDAEGRQLLSVILAHESPWKEAADAQGPGRRTIGALIDMVRKAPAMAGEAAADTLAARGLKVTPAGLLVANAAAPLAQILGGTRWADRGHVPRLRDLPGSTAQENTRIMRGERPTRSTLVPWDVVSGDR
jgi:putative DNA primase/helicase